jgi:hypothetical protein
VFSFLLFFPCGLKGLIKYLNGLPAFFLFFFDGRVGHIVFGETDPLFDKRAKVEPVVLNALAKQVRLRRLNLTSSNGSRNAQNILRIRRLVLAFGRLRRGYGAPGEKPIHLNVHVRIDRSPTASLPLSRTNRQPPDSPECNSSLLSALRRAHRLAAGGQNILPVRRPDWFAYENASNL